jgi:hypothetical protein
VVAKYYATIRVTRCIGEKVKGSNHRGNRRLINVDLFDALRSVRRPHLPRERTLPFNGSGGPAGLRHPLLRGSSGRRPCQACFVTMSGPVSLPGSMSETVVTATTPAGGTFSNRWKGDQTG